MSGEPLGRPRSGARGRFSILKGGQPITYKRASSKHGHAANTGGFPGPALPFLKASQFAAAKGFDWDRSGRAVDGEKAVRRAGFDQQLFSFVSSGPGAPFRNEAWVAWRRSIGPGQGGAGWTRGGGGIIFATFISPNRRGVRRGSSPRQDRAAMLVQFSLLVAVGLLSCGQPKDSWGQGCDLKKVWGHQCPGRRNGWPTKAGRHGWTQLKWNVM